MTWYLPGPGLYLYVTSLLDPERRLSRGAVAAHYVPIIFQFCFRTANMVYHILWSAHIYRGRSFMMREETSKYTEAIGGVKMRQFSFARGGNTGGYHFNPVTAWIIKRDGRVLFRPEAKK